MRTDASINPKKPKLTLIVGVNCTGTGIGTLTRELELVLYRQKDVVYFGPDRFPWGGLRIFSFFYRSSLLCRYLSCLFYVLCNRSRLAQLIVLANYWPLDLGIRKKIILRHPFLVDALMPGHDYLRRAREYFRRFIFEQSLVGSGQLIVQTERMAKKVALMYSRCSLELTILPNPVRDLFTVQEVQLNDFERLFFYPSGYYEHKNFELLIHHLHEERDYCIGSGVCLVLPIDSKKIKCPYVDGLVSAGLLACVGPLKPEQMNFIYSLRPIILFPSLRETYGNGLYEALALNLGCIYNADLLDMPLSERFVGINFDHFSFQGVENMLHRSVEPSETSELLNSADWLRRLISQ